MFHLPQTRQEETGGEGPRERRMTDCYGAGRRILGINVLSDFTENPISICMKNNRSVVESFTAN